MWVEEKQDDFLSYRYQIKKKFFSGKSKWQEVEIVETLGHGRMLLNDKVVMVSERDEFVYHEMMAHVPLFVHPSPKKVLIIGGGDGGTAREVVRHDRVEKCVVVEIDQMVVDACREHLPSCSTGFSHPKVELIINDGIKFMRETEEKFDIILVDSTDPIGPATPLFGQDFYRDLSGALTDEGIVVAQGESPWYYSSMQNKLLEILGKFFAIVTCYNYTNLTYPGGFWSFCWGSRKTHPLNNMIRAKDFACRYYKQDVHRSAFVLPQFQYEQMGHLVKGMK